MDFHAQMGSSGCMLKVAAMQNDNPACKLSTTFEMQHKCTYVLRFYCRCLHVGSLANSMTTKSNEVLCSPVHGTFVANVPQQLTCDRRIQHRW